MDVEEVVLEAEDKMDSAVETLIDSLQTLRTGRANPMLVDKIRVDSYGAMSPIKTVASLSVPEPRILMIQPWDKSMLAPIEKAIMTSDLGIMPANDGNVIRLTMPEMTEDRRKDLVKVAKGRAEDGRVSIRNARRDANTLLKKMEKDKELTEDESKKFQKTIQDKTDSYIGKIDDILQSKEKDIMEV